MTTNQERAAQLLYNEGCGSGDTAHYIARRLADAGLLTPDARPPLPEDVPGGHYLVRWWGEEHPVPAEKVWGQWWVVGLASILPAKDILIVSRLVPEGEQATEETPDPPQSEDVPEPEPGQAWLIDYKGTHYDAVYWYSPLHAHWSFTTSREGLTTINSYDATPVSRLVPEVKQATEEAPDQPRPEDVPAGELWLVEADGQQCAARTIVKAWEVLGRLDREYDIVATSNPRPGRDEYTAGYLAGIDIAYICLQKALEGTHE